MPRFIKKEIDKKLSIGQVADELGVESHVIRFWETKFEQIKPEIGKGHRRYYFAKDVEILKEIKHHLYDSGYTIAGLQKLFSHKTNHINMNNETKNIEKGTDGLTDSQREQIEKILLVIEGKLHRAEGNSGD